MNKKTLIKLAEELKPKNFIYSNKLQSVSKNPFEAHHNKLYVNYVKNYNKIIALLEKTDFSKIKEDVPNSQFSQLKRRVTWASNGAYLHELYFENINGKKTKPESYTLNLIEKDFNNLKKFKDHFLSTALVPNSGWAVWGYSLYDKKTQVVAIENHHNNCPIGFYPILILDMWEHAYWDDFLANKKDYLNSFWEDIDWGVVENRCLLIKKVFQILLE